MHSFEMHKHCSHRQFKNRFSSKSLCPRARSQRHNLASSVQACMLVNPPSRWCSGHSSAMWGIFCIFAFHSTVYCYSRFPKQVEAFHLLRWVINEFNVRDKIMVLIPTSSRFLVDNELVAYQFSTTIQKRDSRFKPFVCFIGRVNS